MLVTLNHVGYFNLYFFTVYPDGSKADLIDIGWDIAAGQCYSTTADLAKLMSLIFSDQKSSEDQVCVHVGAMLECCGGNSVLE